MAIDPNASITVEEYLRIHDIGDPATLARLIAEHPNNQGARTVGTAQDGSDNTNSRPL